MNQSIIRDSLEAALHAATHPSAQHVFTQLLTQSAQAHADAADARRRNGTSLGPLDGKLISIKDLFDITGCITTAGSIIEKDTPAATQDALVVARLRNAGAVLIGRTNMSEYAFSGLGLNPHWGTPGSACDITRAPGGSTSGGAVSVGLGIASIALGSDTGGSTRIPAAFNGIVGFKPTSDRIPKQGAFPLSYTLDSVGPLARNIWECAATDAILAGEVPLPLHAAALSGLRIAVPRGLLFEDTEAEVANAFEAGLAALSKRGAQIIDISIDDHIRKMRETLAIAPIVACEASEIHAKSLATRPGDFDRRVLARIMAGHAIPARSYIHALRQREILKTALAERIQTFDTLALPTCAILPPLIAPLEADDALFARINILVLRNTSVANFFDLPALSLPLPVTGLPVGLMLWGMPHGDRRLFSIGKAVEETLAR